jgi:hypothetical protein
MQKLASLTSRSDRARAEAACHAQVAQLPTLPHVRTVSAVPVPQIGISTSSDSPRTAKERSDDCVCRERAAVQRAHLYGERLPKIHF